MEFHNIFLSPFIKKIGLGEEIPTKVLFQAAQTTLFQKVLLQIELKIATNMFRYMGTEENEVQEV